MVPPASGKNRRCYKSFNQLKRPHSERLWCWNYRVWLLDWREENPSLLKVGEWRQLSESAPEEQLHGSHLHCEIRVPSVAGADVKHRIGGRDRIQRSSIVAENRELRVQCAREWWTTQQSLIHSFHKKEDDKRILEAMTWLIRAEADGFDPKRTWGISFLSILIRTDEQNQKEGISRVSDFVRWWDGWGFTIPPAILGFGSCDPVFDWITCQSWREKIGSKKRVSEESRFTQSSQEMEL